MAKLVTKGLKYSALTITASVIFSFTSTNLSSLYILGELGGSNTTASYTISLFGIGNALTIPLGTNHGGKLGMKKMTWCCIFLFLLATFFLGLSPNYPIFCLFRFLQGLFSGPLFALVSSLLSPLSSTEQKQELTLNLTAIFITVSTLSACLGGVIAYEYTWRWIFLIDWCVPFIASIFFYFSLKKEVFEIDQRPFDFIGYAAYFISILSISLFFILGQELDWLTSNLLVACLILFIIFFPLFILQLTLHPNPILNFRLLITKRMIVALIELSILFGTYYAMMFMLSIWLHLYAAYTPTWIALVLGCMLISTAVVFYLVSFHHKRTSPLLLVTAITIILIASVMTMQYNVDIDLFRLSVSRTITGIGLALFLPPLLFMILNCCENEPGIEALALFHIFRTLGAGLGLSIISTIWQRREVFYHLRLGGALTPTSQLVHQFYERTREAFFTPAMSKDALSDALEREAVSLALNDCFYLIAILMAFLLVLLFALLISERKPKPHPVNIFPKKLS